MEEYLLGEEAHVVSLAMAIWRIGYNLNLLNFFEGCTVNDISAGWNHSAFATGSGHLFMCGDGSFGQLGNGNNSSHCLPQEVLFFQSMHVEQVACGMRHSLVLVRGSSGYSVYGYGSGRHGQIGRQLREHRKFVSTPEIIHGFEGSTVDFLYANGDHSAALSEGSTGTWTVINLESFLHP
ncbi:hypothetical protein HPP92_019599 [Vanilla planifolia]|uniref:Uncharacterized protein n=1 Tax=Vanilla planifolia TaxID=51239 RepID=A0A835Q3H2_VANPL|nr:hypothetical protein HPP92_019599 [Vanilla planifolia]